MRLLCITLIALGFACGDDDRGRPLSDSGSDTTMVDTGGGGGACSSAALMTDVVEFCRTQNPDAPAPRSIGAACTTDSQCDRDWCYDGFSGQYCTVPCPLGTECPPDFSCQDLGGTRGPGCQREICVYGGTDAADCVTNLNREVEEGCRSCQNELRAWLTCIRGAGRLCGPSQADAACGIERGLLESCCIGCSTSSW